VILRLNVLILPKNIRINWIIEEFLRQHSSNLVVLGREAVKGRQLYQNWKTSLAAKLVIIDTFADSW